MLTKSEIDEINGDLMRGSTPEEVGAKRGMTRTQLNYALLSSGKKIVSVTRRFLADTAPASEQPSPELTTQ